MSTERPSLRVVAGNPNAEELAAVVVVLSAIGNGQAAAATAKPEGQWANPVRSHRAAVTPGGPGSWWASGLPR